MYIPDPIERMEAQIERMADEYEEGHCMACGKNVGEDNLIPATPSPATPVVCYECLSPEDQKAYGSINK